MDTAYIQSWLSPNFSNLLSPFLLLALFLVYCLCLAIYRLFLSPLRSIPGPWYAAVSDLWLTTHVLRLRRCRAVDDLFTRYGPVVRVAPNKVFFLDVPTMRSVYGASSRLSKSSWYKCLLTNENDHAMTTLEHAPHAAIKKGYAPHYTPTNLALFQPEIQDFTLELVQSLTAAAQTRVSHDTLAVFRHLMIDVNCAHLFGCRVGSLRKWAHDFSNTSDPIGTATNDFPKRGLIRSALPRWLWSLVIRIPNARWRLLCDSDNILAEFVGARVYETRAQIALGKVGFNDGGKPTFLTRLLQHRYTPLSDLMPDKDIISEGMGHLIAGTDTTSTTLSYIFWELSRRRDITTKLQAEIDEAMPDAQRIPDIQVLQTLPFLGAMIKEVLRKYGAAPSPLERVVPDSKDSTIAHAPFTLLGHSLPPGTVVATQAWSSHRLPSIFSAPDSFNPERWIPDSSSVENLGNKERLLPDVAAMNAHMIPFGYGTRVCGGQNLAQMMLRIVVAAIVRNFDVYAPEETNERSMDVRDSFVIFPAAMQCKLIFLPRKQ